MGRKLRSFLSVFTRVDRTERRRAGAAASTVALLALAVGVYSAVDAVPAHAVTNPDVTAPERVYTGINQDLAFTNTVDPISQNNRTIAVSLTDGPVCHTDPTDSSYSILGCSRIQLDVQTTAAGKLFIPGNTVMNTAFSNGNVIVNTANHTVIDVATDPAGGPSWVYHISGTEADINDTLATMVFQPAQDYEDTSPSPAILQMSGINGSDAAVKTVYTEIKVEGQNGAPDLTVPATNQVAPSGQTTDFPDGLSPQTDPDTNPLATAVDPEMCNFTICGAPYTNPGGVEADDAMLLIAYLDPACGQFALRGGQFSARGGVLNTTVLALLTNVSTGQNPGLELTGDQAAAVLSTLSLQAQTVDLQPQPSDPTTLMNAFAGVGDLAEVRYAISQIHYKAPAGDMTCQLNLAVSDLGNSGMPALKGYVGSPIGGANQPQPGYEVPDAKAVEKTITFDVKDTHPNVTIEQTKPGLAGDPTNTNPEYTVTFDTTMENLTEADLNVNNSGGGTLTLNITPSGPSDTYDVLVNNSADGDITLSMAAGKEHAQGHGSDPNYTNDASTSNDNKITFDKTSPTPTITKGAAQADPASVQPILFDVVFDENVNPLTFDGSDIDLSTSTAGGTLVPVVTPVDAKHFTVSVGGMTTSGNVTASVIAGGVKDIAGNDSFASPNPATVAWNGPSDNTKPDVDIEQAGADPTSTSPIDFTATFSEPVVGFTGSDVAITGTAAAGTTATVSGGPVVYTVHVTGMTAAGTIIASVPAGVANDLSNNSNNASTSVDHTVTWQQPAGVATHFSVSAPSTAHIGSQFAVQVTALDASNQTATSYAGTVHFTSTDGLATLPANTTLVNGTKQFLVTLTSSGAQTVSATDTVNSLITGTSSTITASNVAIPAATHFGVSAAASTTAGSSVSVTVTALDGSNAATTNYTGTIHFSSTDGSAVLPANTMLVNGVGTFPVTFKTTGNQTVTAADTVTASIKGVTGAVAVAAGATTHFTVTGPASVVANVATSVTVTAKDQFGNTVTGYAGTVHFTSSDGAAVLPANAGLVNGTKSFPVTLKTPGTRTVTAADSVNPAISGFANISVIGPATHFSVTSGSSQTAGGAFTVFVTALNSLNQVATTYGGTVHFTSTDGGAVLPSDFTLVNGTGSAGVTLTSAGSQTVTATDTVTASITGTTGAINVDGGNATSFDVSIPAATHVNSAFSAVVTARDVYHNVANHYLGTVDITASGGTPTLPAPAQLVNGTGVFSVTFAATGIGITVTATDSGNPSITGTSAATTVDNLTPGPVTHLSVTSNATAQAGVALSVTVTALDASNLVATAYNGPVDFSSTDGAAVLPANGSALVNGVAIFPVTFHTAGTQTVTAKDSANPTPTGTSASIAVAAGTPDHLVVTAPANAVKSVAINVTVTVKDFYGNTITSGYNNPVHFTSTDVAATLPADSTLVNGTASFPVTLKTVGNQTVTATDSTNSSVTGTTGAIAVAQPGAATHFTVTAPASMTAGVSGSFTVQALDASNLATTNYSGTVHFTSTDGAAVLPANSTLVNGSGTFSATLKTAGNQTLTATDTVTPSKTGTSGNIAVGAAAATHLSVSGPASATKGLAASVTVTALDAFNNVATGYAGTVHLTSTDVAAVLGGNNTLSSGVRQFAVTFNTLGNQTVTATDTVTSLITGTSANINVTLLPPNPATHFAVTAAASATAGTSLSVTVQALDAGNAATTGYAGTVHFTSSDGSAVLPINSTLVGGAGIFPVTLKTAGNQTVTATDTVTASITGTTAAINVAAGAATHYTVTIPPAASKGVAFTATVTAKDAFDNTVTNYAGTAHLTSTDGAAVLGADNTLTNGVGSFAVTMNTLGNQTVTATDTVSNAITGTSAATAVGDPATHFSVSAPASATAGTSFNVTVTALNAANATVSTYSGTVHFTSTSAGTLPADTTLVNGVGVLAVTLTTSGNQTVTATDTSAPITGVSGTVNVAAGPAAQFDLSTPVLLQVSSFNPATHQREAAGSQFSFTVTAVDQYNNVATSYNGTVHFTSDDPAAVLPPDTKLVNGFGTFTATFITLGTHSLSVSDPSNPTIKAGVVLGVVVTAPTTTTTTAPTVPNGTGLPATGADSFGIGWFAALFLVCGGTLLLLRLRRRRPDPTRV